MPPTSRPRPARTTQAVAALLRKAGFTAGKRHTTRTRGWYDYSPGFKTGRCDDGPVRVEYLHHWSIPDADCAAALASYRAALTAAGLAVVGEGRGWFKVAESNNA